MDYPIKWIRKKGNKNMYLRVRDGVIYVTSPYTTTKRQVYSFIESKKDWILKQKDIQPSILQEGYRTQVLGKSVVVHFSDHCSYQEDQLILSNKSATNKRFLQSLVQPIIERRFSYWSKVMGIDNIEIKYGFYKSKWGSCTPSKRLIRFNVYLVFTDQQIIDSIIVHELAHMRHCNHSKYFYNEIDKYLKNYREIECRLKKLVVPKL